MAMKIKISKMTAEDIPQICDIEEKSFPIPWQTDTFKHELTNMLATYLVAKDSEKVIGFIGAWFVMDECQITNIAVDEEYRKKGIASQLVTELFKECKKHGTNYIMLEVRVNNLVAQKLYAKHGFVEEVIRKGYYKNPDGTHEDAIVMSKDIK